MSWWRAGCGRWRNGKRTARSSWTCRGVPDEPEDAGAEPCRDHRAGPGCVGAVLRRRQRGGGGGAGRVALGVLRRPGRVPAGAGRERVRTAGRPRRGHRPVPREPGKVSPMRALRFHQARELAVEKVAEPGPPGPGEVLLRPALCGICGTDLHEYTDGPIVTPARPHPLTGAELPQILGHEFSAVVAEAGPGVTHVRAGDLVTVMP